MKNQSQQPGLNVAGKGKKKKLTLEQRLAIQDIAAKLVFISLFAGCGGSSKGYQLANMLELLAVEWDKNARESFSQNFPNVPVEGLDISKLTGKQILDLTGLPPGILDVFDASPPCQGISTANTFRNTFDARNSLYLKTIRLINEVQPKVFIIENVSGLIKGKMKGFFNQVVDELSKLDYYCEYKVLKANEHCVPQARERCYIVGLRGDIYRKFGRLPLFPERDLETAKRMRVCDVLPHIQAFSPGQFQDRITPSTRPFCTITKTASAWVYDENGLRRKPTIAELKVLSSFPKDFKLVGSFNQQWARIGNAVPPNLAEAIGLNISERVLTQEVLGYTRSNKALAFAKEMSDRAIFIWGRLRHETGSMIHGIRKSAILLKSLHKQIISNDISQPNENTITKRKKEKMDDGEMYLYGEKIPKYHGVEKSIFWKLCICIS